MRCQARNYLTMALYPQWNPESNPANHLLFDIGFSYALITRAERLLREAYCHLILDPELLEEIDDLLAQMESLKKGRLQIVSEVYAAAQEAANRGTPQFCRGVANFIAYFRSMMTCNIGSTSDWHLLFHRD